VIEEELVPSCDDERPLIEVETSAVEVYVTDEHMFETGIIHIVHRDD